ncbi:PAS domain S-box protein [Candidatus Pristimantibacillus sp. PTI5]|uniref:PAS domain S-box protein n=1 Tax=Candidatus Pristimantibacillus sp. PTI5 TaxID=3400422 RepID=UPI003B029DEF
MTEFLMGAAVIILLFQLFHIIVMRRKNKQTRQNLEESEAKRFLIENLLRTLDVGTLTYDEKSQKTVYYSESLVRITGYSMEMFEDKDAWISIVHPEDLYLFNQLMESVNQGNSDLGEYRVFHAEGEIIWLQVRIIPTLGYEGQLSRLDAAIIDITQKKEMEAALQRSEQRYKSLFEYNSDVICELDLKGNVLNINTASLMITGELFNDQDAGNLLAEMFGEEGLRHMTAYFEQTKQGKPQNYEMLSRHKDGRVFHWDMKQIPIFVNHKVVGAFAICKDITSKKKTEQALIRSEAMYRLIAENMTDLVGVVSPAGVFEYASPSYKRGLGIDPEQLTGTSVFDYTHPDDLKMIHEKFFRMPRTTSTQEARCRIMHADGGSAYFDCLATSILDENGEIKSIIFVSRNVNEKVRIEKDLKGSEERYGRFIELSPQPIAAQRNGKFIYINPVGLRLLGAKHMDDIVGKCIYDIVSPYEKLQAQSGGNEISNRIYSGPIEYTLIRLDGQTVEAEVTNIYDEHTNISLHVFNDFTERNRMEAALKESEERYRRLVELSPTAISVFKDEKLIYINPSGLKIFGADNLEEVIGSKPWDWVPDEEKSRSKGLLEESVRLGYITPVEMTVIQKNGQRIEVSVAAIYDSHSSAVEIVFEDISLRKQAEKALQESEALNRQLVELSPVAIILHCDYKFTYVNPAGLALFGVLSLNELVDRSILGFIHPDSRELAVKRLERVYAQKGVSSLVEQKSLRLDGTVIDVEVIANSIYYKGRNAGLTLIRDITDRKKAEADKNYAEQILRESKDRYFLLHTSLDRFSGELFGIMKVHELDRRLVKEIQDILKIEKVSLVLVDNGESATVKSGNPTIPEQVMSEITAYSLGQIPKCEIIDLKEGHFLKIGELMGSYYLLCIGETSPSLSLEPKRVWLETITRYASVLYDNFLVIEDLTKELEQITSQQVTPTWLLRLLFSISENERKRLSQDLHDAALQELMIWYRMIDQVATGEQIPQELQTKLGLITQGLLDVVYQIRITCNELRPPMLQEAGLVTSLEALFEFTQLRTNYSIRFDYADFHHTPSDDLLIGLYRIVQELLANATKHSNAWKVHITLFSLDNFIQLSYIDNGIGMDVSGIEDSFNRMGVYGMKERVRSLEGRIEFNSSPNEGLAILITIPAK